METTRRNFLKKTSTFASSAISLSAIGRPLAFAAASERPRIANIGLRNQGIWDAQYATPFADIVAIADVDSKVLGRCRDKIGEFQNGRKPEGFMDYHNVLERKDIDAVFIATPDHWHTKIAVEAMRAGKDVYCQKPLTLTIDEGKLLCRMVEKTESVFQVGTQQRSEGPFLQAVAMVQNGRLGKIKKVTCGVGQVPTSGAIPVAPVPKTLDWDFWLGPAPEVAYRALPEMRTGYGGGVPLYSNAHYAFRWWLQYSGGKLTDWGAHHVDIATWAIGCDDTGPSKIVLADYEMPMSFEHGYPTLDDRYNVPKKFTFTAKMPGDIDLVVTSTQVSGRDNGILFEGSEGRMFVNRGVIAGKPVEDLEKNPLPEDALTKAYRGMKPGNHYRNFCECVKSRQTPISDVASHHRILTTCHLGNIAMRLGRNLDWNPVNEQIIGDEEASSFLAREYRKGYEIKIN